MRTVILVRHGAHAELGQGAQRAVRDRVERAGSCGGDGACRCARRGGDRVVARQSASPRAGDDRAACRATRAAGPDRARARRGRLRRRLPGARSRASTAIQPGSAGMPNAIARAARAARRWRRRSAAPSPMSPRSQRTTIPRCASPIATSSAGLVADQLGLGLDRLARVRLRPRIPHHPGMDRRGHAARRAQPAGAAMRSGDRRRRRSHRHSSFPRRARSRAAG